MPTLSEILERNTIEYYDCITVDFGGAAIFHYTTCPWNLTVDGTTYIAGGPLIALSSVSENASFDIGSLDITFAGLIPFAGLNGTGPSVIQDIQTLDYINKNVTIIRVFMENNVVVYDEVTYVGFVNGISATVADTGQTTILIQSSNHWANFERATARYTNEASQKAFYPSDSGFAFAKLVQKEIVWAQPETP